MSVCARAAVSVCVRAAVCLTSDRQKFTNYRAQPVSRRSFTAGARVRSFVCPCESFGGQSGAGKSYPSSTSVSPVSTIPPLLHTHPSIYHPRCIMFFSQHFSFPCQYHSTIAPYPSIHLPPTLYNVSLPVLQFTLSVPFRHCSILIHPSTTHAIYFFSPSTSVSPVSTIPPLLHTHPSIYHPRYIMFLYQYFSFPCQYHSTIAPYPSIHLPPTLYNVSLPALQFPLSVSFHHCCTLLCNYQRHS